MKSHILEQVIGVPMKSTTYQVERTPKCYLPNSADQYQVPSSAEGSNIFRKAVKYLQQAIISQRLLHDVLQVTF
ncbi:GEM-like protein 4 [Gossypium australe]|uniref:GEM-like protein 4 n=1 Tax=Gossypium australe TaxID=47621 RepID=A0A5B6X4H2_9ROSI|nr:GEM-like protein 4 [Gossypium australe]